MKLLIFYNIALVLISCDVTFGVKISNDPSIGQWDVKVIDKEGTVECKSNRGIIDLSDAGIKSIQNRFVKCTDITSVSLARNFISEIPINISDELPDLECLDVQRNRIPLQRLITFQHENLKILKLNHQTTFANVREWMDAEKHDNLELIPIVNNYKPIFPRLEYLDLGGDLFLTFPDYFNVSFPRLRRLDLMDRRIGDIWPKFIEKLPFSLESLHLERNSLKLVNFPYLANIESLFLDENPLNVSRLIIRSEKLRFLSLAKCWLTYVDLNLFQEIPNLSSLDFSYNAIDHLPENVFHYAPHLESLSLSHNEIRNFPRFSLPKLVRLSLSYNRIVDISYPIPFTSLKVLSLRGNRISRIVDTAFQRTTQLQELDLAENHLTTLPTSWCDSLYDLRYLNLKDNLFASIQDMSIGHNANLHDLFVKNKITTEYDIEEFRDLPQKCVVHVV